MIASDFDWYAPDHDLAIPRAIAKSGVTRVKGCDDRRFYGRSGAGSVLGRSLMNCRLPKARYLTSRKCSEALKLGLFCNSGTLASNVLQSPSAIHRNNRPLCFANRSIYANVPP